MRGSPYASSALPLGSGPPWERRPVRRVSVRWSKCRHSKTNDAVGISTAQVPLDCTPRPCSPPELVPGTRMTNLRLQKRLAASIKGVGQRRIWLVHTTRPNFSPPKGVDAARPPPAVSPRLAPTRLPMRRLAGSTAFPADAVAAPVAGACCAHQRSAGVAAACPPRRRRRRRRRAVQPSLRWPRHGSGCVLRATLDLHARPGASRRDAARRCEPATSPTPFCLLRPPSSLAGWTPTRPPRSRWRTAARRSAS